LINRLKTIFFI